MTTFRTPIRRPDGFRPDPGVIRQLAWRIALVVIATAVVLTGMPVWMRAPLSLLAAGATIEFFVRRYRRRGVLDAILMALGGSTVILVLLGLVLDALPSGLTAASWGVSVGLIEIIALVALAYWRAPITGERTLRSQFTVPGLIWTALIGAVLASTLVWAVQSFEETHVAPLALAGVPSGDSVVVTVSSGSDSGPYRLELVRDDEREVLAEDIEVSAGDSASVTVPLQPGERVTVELVTPGSTTPVRELILDTIGETTVTG